MTLRILFVDDDPSVLSTLRQRLRSLQGEWKMTFARGSEEALQILRQDPHDVVVSDRTMPNMDGVTSLTDEVKSWPHLVRVILSGQSDEESTLRSIASTLHDKAIPCEPALLRSTVQRAVSLHHLLRNEPVKVLVTRMDTLPSAPALLGELMRELEKPECSLRRLGEIISQDIAMTAKILRLVNSAYFGLRCQISDPGMAVIFLGITTVCSLVMTCHIFQHADRKLTSWLNLDRIWHHSLATAQWAKRIAEAETMNRQLVDDTLAAGMLHDAGRLVLAVNFPETYRELIQHAASERQDLNECERSVLGVTHAEVGAYLMGTWGLKNTIVEAIAYHHTPSKCVDRRFSPLTAVHAACAMEAERSLESTPSSCAQLDRAYLVEVNLLDRLDHWRSLCEADQGEESASRS